MTKLIEKIISSEPRERAGSTSYNRFDYQQNWALCKILDLHSSSHDYLVCFDYYDDVVIMDSSSDPNKITFYQIKTKSSGRWTLNELLKTTKGKSGNTLNSFLGKLYYNATIFSDNTDNINFVSNASFNIKLEDDSDSSLKSKIYGSEIKKEEIAKINASLKKELELLNESEFENIAILEVAQITIDHHEELTITKLAKFLENSFPGTNYQITPIYNALFGELKRKAKYEKCIVTQEELKEHKSISKDDFNGFLKTCVLDRRESFKDKCDKIEDRLNAEIVSFQFIKKFRRNCVSIEIDKMNKNNRLLNMIIKKIKLIVKKEISSEFGDNLFEHMNMVFDKYTLQKVNQKSYDEDYIKSLILVVLYEN